MTKRQPNAPAAATNVAAFPRPEPRVDAKTRAMVELLTEFLPYLKAHVMEVAFAGPMKARLADFEYDAEIQTGPDELRATGDEVVVAGVDLALQIEQVVELLAGRLAASASAQGRAS